MIRGLLLAALLGLLAARAGAETVTVRSGEHEGFSRLVLPLREPAGWTLGRQGEGYVLRLDRAGIGFDLGRVFHLIPRRRLADVTPLPEGDGLQLALACACHALAFETDAGAIVIDIRDGPPAGSPFEHPDGPAGAEPPAAFPAGLAAPRPAGSFRPPLGPAIRLPGDWAAHLPALPGRAGPGPPLLPATPDAWVGGLEEDLLRQIGRAAAQGLVAPERRSPAPAPPPPPEAVPEPVPDEPGTAAHLRLRAETSIDRDARSGAAGPALTSEGAECPADADLALTGWGDGRPAFLQLAEARSALVGEFDRPDEAAVARLARLHLHLGMGAEAVALLDAFGVAPADAALLRAVAAVLDDTPSARRTPAAALAGMADCDTAAALWALLDPPGPGRGDVVNEAAALRAFSALPLHLRRDLGPRLAEAFLARGADAAAHAVRAAILRAPGGEGSAARLIAARLDLARGDLPSAEAALAPVLEEDGPLSPEALVLHVEARLARGLPVEPGMVAAAAALAHEHRGTPEGPALTRTHVLAAAGAGGFDSAFAALDRWRSDGPDPLQAGTAAEMMALLAGVEDDMLFLGQVFAHRAMPELAEAPDALRLKLAGRLLDLGFAEEARDLLGPAAERSAEGRLLAAGTALRAHAPDRALAALTGIATPEAEALRGEALEMLGRHSEAALAFAAAGAELRAADAAFRAGRWDAAAAAGPGPRAEALHALGLAKRPVSQGMDGPMTEGDPMKMNEPAEDDRATTGTTTHSPAVPGARAGDGPATPEPAAPPPPEAQSTPAPGPVTATRRLLEESRSARAALAQLLESAAIP